MAESVRHQCSNTFDEIWNWICSFFEKLIAQILHSVQRAIGWLAQQLENFIRMIGHALSVLADMFRDSINFITRLAVTPIQMVLAIK